MNSELFGVIVTFLVSVALAIPLGKYMANVYSGKKTFLDFLFNGIENFFYKLSGINAQEALSWRQNLYAFLVLNLVWFIYGFVVLNFQTSLPLNPDHIAPDALSPIAAFNTTISFLANCNIQNYTGTTQLTYFSQIFVLSFFQFVTSAAGLAIGVLIFKSVVNRSTNNLGNFYYYFVRSCTRILFPICLVVAILLMWQGVPMTFKDHGTIKTLEGVVQTVARGPVAGFLAIKQIGVNGGGWFGPNSAHPFENPTYFTNTIELISIFLIPMAFVFAFGFFVNQKKFAAMIFGVMTFGTLLLLVPSLFFESKGNTSIDKKIGVAQVHGSTEGVETRFGALSTSFWAITTTAVSNGSENGAIDSLHPITITSALLAMMINALFGGAGVGFMYYYMFIIISIFVAGLMVGRSPEFMGKKIEAKEMKIAVIVILLHPLLILVPTALTTFVYSLNTDAYQHAWFINHGYHTFTEILYAYSSSTANNGSAMGGVNYGLDYWNMTTAIVILLSRYIPIIGAVAVAGSLATKKYIPTSAGTLAVDSATFSVIVFSIMVIVAALSFFPALVLGPFAEFFTCH
ncbi:MAG: potassium-transporting ATPase subunit KdpA [Phycisphaerales bacterium]|nr:potassium-transporting ATPase subunit KdpA [Phycisphaerales bacterium]